MFSYGNSINRVMISWDCWPITSNSAPICGDKSDNLLWNSCCFNCTPETVHASSWLWFNNKEWYFLCTFDSRSNLWSNSIGFLLTREAIEDTMIELSMLEFGKIPWIKILPVWLPSILEILCACLVLVVTTGHLFLGLCMQPPPQPWSDTSEAITNCGVDCTRDRPFDKRRFWHHQSSSVLCSVFDTSIF